MSKTAFKLVNGVTFPRSPLALPEGKSGHMEVRHRADRCFDVVSMREAITSGLPPTRVRFDEDQRVHVLLEDDQVWMTDVPIELRQIGDAMKTVKPRGRVLVGGLGLGIAARLIAQRPAVKQVDVVEISADVIKLCRPRPDLWTSDTEHKIKVIHADILAYVNGLTSWPYDFAWIDTWRDDNEGTWWYDVFPIKRAIARKFGNKAARTSLYWAEHIMAGQVIKKLRHVMGIGRDVIPHTVPFTPHWFYRDGLPIPMTEAEAIAFVGDVGLPHWEEKYGAIYPEVVFSGSDGD